MECVRNDLERVFSCCELATQIQEEIICVNLRNLRIQLLLVALFFVIFVPLCEDTLCFRPVAAQRLTPILPWIPQLPQQALSCP